jgi:hypothetical protein
MKRCPDRAIDAFGTSRDPLEFVLNFHVDSSLITVAHFSRRTKNNQQVLARGYFCDIFPLSNIFKGARITRHPSDVLQHLPPFAQSARIYGQAAQQVSASTSSRSFGSMSAHSDLYF